MFTRFLNTKIGSIVNVAIYLAASAAIAALIEYFAKLEVSDMPVYYALGVQVINLLLVAIKQSFFKK